MKTVLFILSLILIIANSCVKEEELCKSGSLKVINNTGIVIYVKINVSSSGVNDGDYFLYEGASGPYQVAAKEMTGDSEAPWVYFSSEIISSETTILNIKSLK